MASDVIHRPMVPLAVALMAGCAAGAWFPGRLMPAAIAAAAAIAVVVRAAAVNRAGVIACLGLMVALGYLSIQPWLAPRLGAGHAARFVDGPPVSIVGRVADTPRVAAGRQKFYLVLHAAGDSHGALPDHGRIRVTVQGLAPAIARGDTLRFTARLRSPHNFNNPGGFDYRRYLALQGVYAAAYADAQRVERIAAGPDTGPSAALERFRRKVGRLLDRTLAADSAAVLAALTIGDRSRIGTDLRTVFNRAGVGHLLAISGLHVGIVAALVYALFWRILVWLPFFLERGWARKAAALVTAGAVWGYAVLAGLSPSTQRAALMVSAYLAAMLIERDRDLPNTLALAALIIVAGHPPALFSVSFQLSFLAVAWILAGLRPQPAPDLTPPGPQTRVVKLGGWARRFFFVSLWAILGTLPVVMQTFNQVSLVGLPANFVFVPLIGMLVVPMALAATLLALVSAPAAAMGFAAADVLLAPALRLLRVLAAWPASALVTFTPRPEEVVLYYAALGLGLIWIRRPAIFGPRRRAAICLLVLAAIFADGLYWGHRRFWHADLRATVLDVGQGTATVLELPGGKVALVDGGGFSDNAVFDVGKRLLAPFLRYQKIGAIDLVVLSHANADHLNGLIYVMDSFPVDAVWSNHEGADTLGYRRFVETIERHQLPWPPFDRLPRRSDLGGARIDLLHPPPGFDSRPAAQGRGNANNDSLVLKVSTAHGAILLTGDIEAAAERELVSRVRADLAADVLVVPHHGSRSSTTAALLAAVRPREAVVSCGFRNRYRMPHRSVLERLKSGRARLWRTDDNGAVCVTIDSRGVRVVPFLAGPEGL